MANTRPQAFKPGNQMWKLANPGKKYKYEDPKKLYQKCVEYFEWIEANPLMEAKVFHNEGRIVEAQVPKMRAMTYEGLALFLGVHYRTLNDWVNKATAANSDDFVLRDVVIWAMQVIREQKFTGAAAGLLNPTIISRDLGLAERHEVSGPNGGPIQNEVSAVDRLSSLLDGVAKRQAGGDDA